ncbi:exported hypothetical protein [Verrucomicrobia bacterium]|nr:exported hypothetical protein [Verrucomicrobiota bacterium]
MRRKVVLAVLLAGITLAGLIAWLTTSLRTPGSDAPPSRPEVVSATQAVAETNHESGSKEPQPASAAFSHSPPSNPPAASGSISEADAILVRLNSTDRETRKAALEDATQLEDRSIVPRLREIADRTEDPAEKAEILAAIEFINLPSVTEYLKSQQAQKASGQAGTPAGPTDR